MKTSPSPRYPHRKQGAALILVLCFVVLVTGLIVAYFSRALTTRQLSNASTSTTQAEMLANSAADIILSDLKVEIANGSIASTPPPAALPVGRTVYAPKQAAYAVPQRNPSPAPAATEPIPNLVRRSLRNDSTGGANAALTPAPASGSRASAAASDKPSSNGRYISPARWNRHYLIPTATPAPSVDPSTPVTAFTAPDWVFVTAEKGPDVLSGPSTDASGNVTVTGRYAYAIYDEGGLLDINHTGYPSASTPTHIGAKPAPSYADLTQLPTPLPKPADSALLTAANVDKLLGWRNYATLQAGGAFPALQPSASLADLAYFNLFTSNTALPTSTSQNLLRVPLTVWNNNTDQMFLSRQQLIGYFNAAGLDLRYLQYFGTFSRSLNQPSYLPEHSATTLNPTRPAVRPILGITPITGENDAYGNTGITPNFLAARVATTFKRYDQTDAIVGEPLVKKRFPLNRLAWLTYKGPSASRDTTATSLTGPDGDIGTLKKYGITKEWLDQGTPANILTYFGLTWNGVDKWSYSHGTGGTNGAILNINNPSKSADVVRLTGSDAREPDFFELLKAAINPGSIAKTSISPNILGRDLSTTHAGRDQYNLDRSLDRAILQIGANIIDQFDTDGFPTLIHYDLSSTGAAPSALPFVCGDENVPYISRVTSGLIHLVEADPVETDSSVDPATGGPRKLVNTGAAALMNYPEIWNLHDWSPTAIPQSMGAVSPVNFKVFARANDNDALHQATTVFVWDQAGHNSCDADQPKSPGFADKYHFQFGVYGSNAGGEARYLSESNTKMTFSIDPTSTTGAALFREPTLLFAPGIPNGSNLASPALVASNGGVNGLGNLAMNPGFFGGSGGLISAVGASAPGFNKLPVLGAPYIGFYIGAHPLRFWWDGNNPNAVGTNTGEYQTQYGPVNDIIYTLACEDGNGGWIPYDVKAMTTQGQPNARLQLSTDFGSGFNGVVEMDFGLRYYQTMDPRTSRFGMIDPWIARNTNSIPPRRGYSAVNLAQGTLRPDREGVNSGTALNLGLLSTDYFPSTLGWYPGNSTFGNDAFRPGMLSQNNPNVTADELIASGPGVLLPPDSTGTGPVSPFYYADPDNVVRRAMGGSVDGGGGAPASTTTGLPMAWAKGTVSGNSTATAVAQMDSRPSILNRPFRSVAELGSVYTGTPWKNLDFFQPESGNSALLDVFCVNDNSDGNALTAGQVNLNTHQVPVLQAILAQTSKDQWNDAANPIPGGTGAASQAQQLAQLLITRTASMTGPTSGPNAGTGPQPLQNVSDLVGRWVKGVNASLGGYDGKASCDGFTTDLATFLDAPATADLPMHNIQRFGESAVRALSNSGQTRVWNLMFDIVAQTGRYPAQATSLDQFNVEGEQHYWVHVALDRYTGQILDKQVEVVKE